MIIVGTHGMGRGVGAVMVDAARHWARRPGAVGGFPSDVARSLYAAGLGEALPGLGGLLVIFSVHGHCPLDLGSPGGGVYRADELVLVRMFERVVGQGMVTEREECTLSRWLSPRGVMLGLRILTDLAEVPFQRTSRAALPPEEMAEVLPFPTMVAAE